ncbi:transporter substrate-binding domain-containing protein [Paenibacillus sp. 1781tsa1]|uniref:transporter substrate-binding domain-containing protein n=1 Tax=Paenibacillus sp. 1781tsa1 TaxID=2953810 RepID=UPI0020A1E4D8|nr:transporter substrate-binding domain-containing protein [Paenibacillus sp. 1781tsa1]MCP1181798.1 transporter substrate-binding domain-containing protein [Paenibacillus sp. 1781tsa1]
MKKLLKWPSFMLVLILSLVLSGCSTGEENSSSGGSGGSGGDAVAKGTIEQIKERGKLIAGVKYDTKLFGLKDPASGNVEGFDIDIAKALAKQILGDETKVELKEVTSKTRIPMLQNGDIDIIIATMTITDERKEQVDFSDVYFEAGQSLLVKNDSPITGLESLSGVKVLAVKGSTSAQNIREKAPDAEVLEFDNYQDAFTALKAGKGEALTTDNIILIGMQQTDNSFQLVGGNFTSEPYGMAIRKGDTAFVEEVNKLLKSMKDSGEYDTLHEKWLGSKPE